MSAARSSTRVAATRRAIYQGPGLGAWLRSHRRAGGDALARLREAPLASAATLAVLALALLLPLLLGLFLANVLRFAESIGTGHEIRVFLDADADTARALSLMQVFSARSDVSRVVVRTPAEGFVEFQATSDLADALDLLEGNPLPYVLLVTPLGTARSDAAQLAAALRAETGVASVQDDAAWRERLDAWLALARRAVVLLALLLIAGAALVVGNTVRLKLAARRDEIALLQLFGADDADIRRPLLHFGVVLGLLAGVAALLGAWLVGLALRAPLAELIETYAGGFTPTGPGLAGSVLVLLAAVLLGWLGARVAAGHYLRTSQPVDQ